MSTQLKLRRGTTAQHSTFTGASGEITVDTTKKTVVVHDGTTAGGVPLAKESDVAGFLTSATAASTYAPLASPTFSGSITASSGTANGVAYLNGSKVLTTGSALTFDGTTLNAPSLVNAGSFRAISNATSPSGYGLELLGGSSNNYIVAYNRSTASFLPLRVQSSTFTLDVGAGAAPIYYADTSFQSWNMGGSEQMRLTSTGLGIGTSSPGYKLHVNGGNAAFVNSSASTVYFGTGFGSNQYGWVQFNSSGPAMRIGSDQAVSLQVVTSNNTVATFDTSGNLGLGVTPSAWANYKALQIPGGSIAGYGVSPYEQIHVINNAYYDGANWRYVATNNASRYYQTSGQHIWSTAPSGTAGDAISFTQAMTLDASGNLGIGTSSPSSPVGFAQNLTIANSSSSSLVVKAGASSQYVTEIGMSSGGGWVGTSSNDVLRLVTNATERMRIDSSGNVGIGTSSPAVKLNVNGNQINYGTNPYIGLSNAYNTTPAYIQYLTSTNIMAISCAATTGQITFATGAGDERMRIDSSGNVGIGTSSPSTKLQVNGCAAIQGSGSPSSGSGLELKYDGTRSVVLSYNRTGSAYLPLWTDGLEHLWYVSGSERMRIAATGETIVKAALQETKSALAANDISLSTGNYFTKTISGATTFTVSNVPASGTVGAFILELTNGGSATVTWFSGVKWASGTAPTLTAAGVDIIAFYTHDGGTTWRGAVVSKDSK